MSMRVELSQGGELVDGIEQWWDEVELVLAGADGEYRILRSISPYGDLRLPHDRLRDLEEECHRLAVATTNLQVRDLLLRVAALCERAADSEDAELRFNGD